MNLKKLLSFLLCLLIICACSSKDQKPEGFDLLSTDINTMDFVLNDVVYTMPCSLSDLLSNGWEINDINDDLKEEKLPANSYMIAELHHKEFSGTTLTIYATNQTDQAVMLLNEATIEYMEIKYSSNKVSTILKGGITEQSSKNEVNHIMKDLQESLDSEVEYDDDFILSKDGEIVLYITFESDTINGIEIGIENKIKTLTKYETESQSAENIKALKERFGELYKNDKSYEQIKEALSDDSIFSGIYVYKKLTISDKIDSQSTFILNEHQNTFDGSSYIAVDEEGNIFAFDEKVLQGDKLIPLNELKKGDVIEVWGMANSLLYDDTTSVPVLSLYLVEQDGNVIYRDLNFQE